MLKFERVNHMKQIEHVCIVGFGALGIMFGSMINRGFPACGPDFCADEERISRYRSQTYICNGEVCSFSFVTPAVSRTYDLIIFATKYSGLRDAIQSVQNKIHPQTILISLLNGITSEEIIGNALGQEKIIRSIAQGMDTTKLGTEVTFSHCGQIIFGLTQDEAYKKPKQETLAAFFDKCGIPYTLSQDIRRSMWSKLMLNVGVNQATAAFDTGYGGVNRPGEARQTMIAAMREAMAVANCEGINLGEQDLADYLSMLAVLADAGMPSMRQDILLGRPTEVELFAGTILAYAKKHGLETPVNRRLYKIIKEKEKNVGENHQLYGRS